MGSRSAAVANLAATYSNMGRLAEAKELQVEVLAAIRRVRGTAHPRTLAVARNLARTCHTQARDTDAEELHALYSL